ncbi:outer-membrane lipoprotein carrier protein LolA [Myxococcota bacterium]|nr:outer-membrane lipoprotein carrier protein LolA [Myxococcota bacterium]
MSFSVFLFVSMLLLPAASETTIPAELLQIAKVMHSVQSLQAHMEQEKELSIFGEVLKSSGTLSFSRPGKLRMELTGDGGHTLVINDDEVAIHYKSLGKTERKKLATDPQAKAIAEHLFMLLDADPKALDKVYAISIIPTVSDKQSKTTAIILKPKAEALAAIINRVEVEFNAQSFVKTLTIFERSGDLTRWLLSKQRSNIKLSQELFTL